MQRIPSSSFDMFREPSSSVNGFDVTYQFEKKIKEIELLKNYSFLDTNATEAQDTRQASQT